MRIAVIDVAAESGGALSVLRDFLSYLVENNDGGDEFYVFVSKEVDIKNDHIHYVLKPGIKKSWISRLRWERFSAIKELTKLKIDSVFSLQNTAFFSRKIHQTVYFHNVLLLEPKNKYSIFKKSERRFGIYTNVIAPYTIRSLKYADTIICQTNCVREEIQKRIPNTRTVTINPNVQVENKFVHSAVRPIKGFIYPTAAVPFKHIEDIVKCVKEHEDWFTQKNLEVLITINGKENAYAQSVYEMGENTRNIKFIGYQNRTDILGLYRDHALIINSELESFPLPFREAEIVGTPILAADYPYAREILSPIPDACLFKKNDINDMFSRFLWVIERDQVKHDDYTVYENSWSKVMEEVLHFEE